MPATIEDYAVEEGDVFEFTEHVVSYLLPNGRLPVEDGRPQPKIAFLQMERKTDHLDELASFLNVSGVTADVLQAKLSPWRHVLRAELQAEHLLGLRAGGAAGAAPRGLAALLSPEEREQAGDAEVGLLAHRLLHSATGLFAPAAADSESEPSEESPSAALEAQIDAKFGELRAMMDEMPGEGFYVHERKS